MNCWMNITILKEKWKRENVHNLMHSFSVCPIKKKNLPKEKRELSEDLILCSLIEERKGFLKPIDVHWDRLI